jgi:hypothetical protein
MHHDGRVQLLHACAIGIGVVVLFHGGVAFARTVEVTDCRARVTGEASSRYVLTGDVDCADESVPAIVLASGDSLELDGHTLSDGDVVCSGSCRIVGPGTIVRGGVTAGGRVVMLRTTITGSPSNGVLATNGKGRARATIIDSSITGSALTGVEADRMMRIIRSRIVGNGRHGVAVALQPSNDCMRGRIRSRLSTISGNGLADACVATEVCADVASCARGGSELRGTECGTSYELESGMPGRSCGVCALD